MLALRLFSVLATLLIFAKVAAAQSPIPPAAGSAIVQIDNRGYGGGSGTYLGDGYVLTCDHLFRDSHNGQIEIGRVVVSFPSGAASTATVLKQHRVWDLALLKLDAPPNDVAGISLAESYPSPGTTVISVGYGRSGELLGNVGQVTGYGRDKYLATQLSDTMLLTGSARGGDSGGPILSESGQLVGVLWGTDGSSVVGTQVGQCRQILTQWQCPAGGCSPPRYVAPSRPVTRRPPTISGPSSSGIATPSQPSVPSAELEKLRQELAQLKQQIAAIQCQPGPRGPQGEPGPQGPPGNPADVDLTRLTQLVRQQIAGSIRVKVEPVRK